MVLVGRECFQEIVYATRCDVLTHLCLFKPPLPRPLPAGPAMPGRPLPLLPVVFAAG
jgi:hypothetical protein